MRTPKPVSAFKIDEYSFWRELLNEEFTEVTSAPPLVASKQRRLTVRAVLDVNSSTTGARGRPTLTKRATPPSDESLWAYLQLTGETWVRSRQQSIVMRPGVFFLLAESAASPGPNDTSAEVLGVRISRRLFPRVAIGPTNQTVHLGEEAARLVRALLDDSGSAEIASVQAIVSCLAHLMAVMFGAPAEGLEWSRHSLRRQTWHRIENYIRDHAMEPTLSAESVREHFGISMRALQQMLDDNRSSFHRLVLEGRLDGCAKELACNLGALRSITHVAQRWGFSNAAYFCKVFRERFGVSASEYRALGGSPGIDPRPASRDGERLASAYGRPMFAGGASY